MVRRKRTRTSRRSRASGPAIIRSNHLQGITRNVISNLSRAAGRASGPDRAPDRPGGFHGCVCGDTKGRDPRHRRPVIFRTGTIRASGCWPDRCPALPRHSRTTSIDVAPGGGSESPEPDAGAEGALFVVGGELTLKLAGTEHVLRPGGFAYLPPGSSWSVQNRGSGSVHFHWIRKLYQRVPDIAVPDAIVTNENAIAPTPMPGTRWQVGDDAFRRSIRYQARHAHDDRHFRTRCVDPLRRDPCDGARPLCSGRQGRLPAQPGLG